MELYPVAPDARTRWIRARRGPKNTLDPRRAYGAFAEEEPGPDGTLWSTLTLLLTNRECPFTCLMCDLWKETLDTPTVPGAIPEQLAVALATLPPARAIKLYNAGSFFDPLAIPPDDYPAIAVQVRGFERVIVESHVAFLRGAHAERVLAFQELIRPATLEVAIGLETAHPAVLEKLNKRMTVAQFQAAAAFLAAHAIALRVFILVRPPFLTEEEGITWACRSVDVAQDAGATFVALIPTRAGNGALEVLATTGAFTPPRLASLETCLRYGLSRQRGRVTADLWDGERFVQDPDDAARLVRLAEMNRTQKPGAS